MGKGFCALFKKDCRMLASGKFFLMAIGFLALYTAYVNLGYIRFMQMAPYNVYLYDPAEPSFFREDCQRSCPGGTQQQMLQNLAGGIWEITRSMCGSIPRGCW